MEHWYLFIAAGLMAGLLSAMFGVGSGIILVPLLALAFHFPQKSAQGISLCIMVPMALAGAIRYKMNPAIPIDHIPVLFLSIGAVVGALAGGTLVHYIPGGVLRKMFAVFVIIVGVKMLLPTQRRTQPEAPAPNPQTAEPVAGHAPDKTG